MKKIFFVNALEFGIVIAALIANFNVLPVGWVVALILLALANIWLGLKMFRFDRSTSWRSAFNCAGITGVIAFLGLGITGMCVEAAKLDGYAYAALGTFLFGTLLMFLVSLPVKEDNPKHLIYSVIGCVFYMCAGWIMGLFGDYVAPWAEKLMAAFAFIVFGYFIVSLACFIYSSIFRR